MAINDMQKIDYLWKKVIFGVTDTDITGKFAPNETIASPIVVDSRYVWGEGNLITTTAPTATNTVVEVKKGTDAVVMIPDPSVAGNRTWVAVTDPSDINTRVPMWIPPSYGPDYLLKVYTNSTVDPVNSLNPIAANNEWIFDYVAGTLQFINNVPAAGSGLIIEGYRYIGAVGGGTGTGSTGAGTHNELSDDLSPELGGNLNVHDKTIFSNTGQIVFDTGPGASIIKADTTADLKLEGGAGANVMIANTKYPNGVGSIGQILQVDINGDLQFVTQSSQALPNGSNPGEIIVWNGTLWEIAGAPSGVVPGGSFEGDILVWSTGASSWVPTANPVAVPDGSAQGDILSWDDTNSVWETIQPTTGGGGITLPTSGATNDVLTWNGTAWIAQSIVLPAHNHDTEYSAITHDHDSDYSAIGHTHTLSEVTDFPTGTDGQVLTLVSGSWQAATATGGSTLPTTATLNDVLTWDGSDWVAQVAAAGAFTDWTDIPNKPSGADGQVLTLVSGSWQAANPPAGGGSLPGTANTNDVLSYNGTAWVAQPIVLPTHDHDSDYSAIGHTHTLSEVTDFPTGTDGQVLTLVSGTWQAATATGGATLPGTATLNDVLTWNGSDWVAQVAAAGAFTDWTDIPNKPSGTDGQVLTLVSGTWQAATASGGSALPTGTSGQILLSDGTDWLASNADYAPTVHSHSEYAPTAHTHTGYASTSHNHTLSDITNFPTGSANDVLTHNGTDWVAQAPSGGGAGEANTASNLAGDEGVFVGKVGDDLQFKSLIAGSNVTMTSDANAITINAASGGGGGGGSYEYAILQYAPANEINQAATVTSSGVTVRYIDTSAANVVGFTFTGYNVPPANIVIYAQQVVTNEWKVIDSSGLVDTPVTIADTGAFDMLNMSGFGGEVQMGLTYTNTKATNKPFPAIFAKIIVMFAMND